MSLVLDAVQDLKLVDPLFQNVKFYVSGKAHEKVSEVHYVLMTSLVRPVCMHLMTRE
jgi:hypothetical protein